MKKVAIIGASYLQLPLVLKAKELGIETHCFAWQEMAVCKDYADFFYPISVMEKEAILSKCQSIGIDGILTIATDIAMPTITYVAQNMGLISNNFETTVNSTDKWRMREQFAKNNCPIPKYKIAVSNKDDFSDFNFPIIVKPVDMSGSRGVSKIERTEDVSAAIQYAIENSISKRAIVEEFIDGEEVSVESVSWQGNHFPIVITDKITTGAPYFVELAHHQPSALDQKTQEKINKVTIEALKALNVEYGASHTELKINSKGDLYIIEVGARMGGDFIGSHLVELSTGYDFLKATLEIALGEFEVPIKKHKKYSGVYFLCKESERLLPYFGSNETFIVQKELQNTELKNIQNSNDRSGYLIYQDEKRLELALS